VSRVWRSDAQEHCIGQSGRTTVYTSRQARSVRCVDYKLVIEVDGKISSCCGIRANSSSLTLRDLQTSLLSQIRNRVLVSLS
jgi:hypothetical protein